MSLSVVPVTKENQFFAPAPDGTETALTPQDLEKAHVPEMISSEVEPLTATSSVESEDAANETTEDLTRPIDAAPGVERSNPREIDEISALRENQWERRSTDNSSFWLTARMRLGNGSDARPGTLQFGFGRIFNDELQSRGVVAHRIRQEEPGRAYLKLQYRF